MFIVALLLGGDHGSASLKMYSHGHAWAHPDPIEHVSISNHGRRLTFTGQLQRWNGRWC
jgi:hypothetical protein